MSNISSTSSRTSWEAIKETALKNQNLNADIRVSDRAVQVDMHEIMEDVKIEFGLDKGYASREETLENLQNQFDVYFSKELCRLVDETGVHTDEAECKKLVTEAMQQSKAITQKLTTTIATKPSISTSQAIQEAHLGALNSLSLLRSTFATPELTPQFCVTKEGQISVLQPAPHPENFVLSGGGVKGAGYVGWFKAAEQFGVLKNLKRLAGSSAGAITGAMIASGMNAEDFEKATKRTSFWSMLIGVSNNPTVERATNLETKGWSSWLGFSGTYAVDHINHQMVDSIKKYFDTFQTEKDFQTHTSKILSELKLDKQEESQLRTTLDEIYQKITPPPRRWLFGSWFQKKQPTYMVKFKDLAALTKIDPRFKELTITGYDRQEKKEKYYNATTAADLPIAEAVRGSIALPPAFRPIVIDGAEIVDGGIGSNVPSEAFKGFSKAKTLVLQFENDGSFNQVVYGINNDKKSQGVAGVIEQGIAAVEEEAKEVFSGNDHLAEKSQWDNKKLHDAGPNAMMVAKGDLETMSFGASPEELRRAQLQAEIRATEAFSLRQNQGELTSMARVLYGLNSQSTDQVFSSLKEAMKSMRSNELENIVLHYSSNSDGKDLLTEADRLKISQAAQTELAARPQQEFELR